MAERTHLYRAFAADGTLLYVGVSLHALQRLSEHRASSVWFDEVDCVRIERFKTRELALAAEQKAIRAEGPKYNVIHNDLRTRQAKAKLIDHLSVPSDQGLLTRTELAADFGVSYADLFKYSRHPSFPRVAYTSKIKAQYWCRNAVQKWLRDAGKLSEWSYSNVPQPNQAGGSLPP